MKTNLSTTRIGITFLCLALACVVILLTIPLLAKGISQIIGNPIEPEKLDIRPIPVPVPPPPVAINGLPSSATPAPSISAISPAPQAVPVPTAPLSAAPTASSVAQASLSGSSIASTFPVINQEGLMTITLTFLVLLILVWLYGRLSLYTLHRKMQHDRSIC